VNSQYHEYGNDFGPNFPRLVLGPLVVKNSLFVDFNAGPCRTAMTMEGPGYRCSVLAYVSQGFDSFVGGGLEAVVSEKGANWAGKVEPSNVAPALDPYAEALDMVDGCLGDGDEVSTSANKLVLVHVSIVDENVEYVGGHFWGLLEKVLDDRYYWEVCHHHR
jgi:hypothetical protein